ncbi:hypothetical protein [Rhodococcus erythropolis]|uniref:hypothetical protein n=2 Tax=Rhodococcus erythropolis TaxID=1833 RepID=UPI0018A2B9D2|nr:hypothetical protein [Rhodococcus erythropolis]MBF7735992.1 hypothetical protein [Rhodococcus erythropolis]MCZ4643301.1 hypothetical protein [Rhodococcus erythropolis]
MKAKNMRVEKGDVVEALAHDPLYQLSASDPDGFHTGMLYWLLNTTLEVTNPLAGISYPFVGLVAERDWHGFSLFLDEDMGSPKLGIVNTLHTIPNRDKLEKLGRVRLLTDHMVISLIHPANELPQPWRHVPYDELLHPLQKAADDLREIGSHKHEADLLSRYVKLLERLIHLRDHHPLSTGPHDAVVLDVDESSRLKDARLLPLVEKIRLSRFAKYLEQRCGRDVDVDLSESHGSIQYSAPSNSGHLFGWKYQGGRVRLTVKLDYLDVGRWRGQSTKKEEYVRKNFSDFFDFTSIPRVNYGLYDNAPEMKWHSNEPNISFTYRTVTPGITNEELAGILDILSSHVDSYSASL